MSNPEPRTPNLEPLPMNPSLVEPRTPTVAAVLDLRNRAWAEGRGRGGLVLEVSREAWGLLWPELMSLRPVYSGPGGLPADPAEAWAIFSDGVPPNVTVWGCTLELSSALGWLLYVRARRPECYAGQRP